MRKIGPIRTLYAKPEVFGGHTILFPSDFSEDERRFWLNDHRLLPASQTAPECCPRCNDQHMVCEMHPNEPWESDHCKHGAGAPCPVSGWGADLPVHFLDPSHISRELAKVDHHKQTAADRKYEQDHEDAA